MTSKLIEALNKCETRKSYENVRYTLVDDELRAYIEESLERLEVLELENKDLKEKLNGIPPEYDGYLYFAEGISNIIKEIEKLKSIIKENFAYYPDALFEKVCFKWTGPVMEDEIIEVLGNENHSE